MKHERNSHRLFAITRSKAKMFEFGLPEDRHLAVPENTEPQQLFILTVGTLGDVAAILSESDDINSPLPPSTLEELGFSASFFDAFLESRFNQAITRDAALLAASAYYLARRPGSSLVLARRIDERKEGPSVDKLLLWTLVAKWSNYPFDLHPQFGESLGNVAKALAFHFHDGSGLAELNSELDSLRRRAYAVASPRDLLFIDIITAIIRMRITASAWTTLPEFTGIAAEQWASAIRRREFPKELWPSQMLLGSAGIFSGASGIVQMPTSSGKTRSIEIVLRSGFLSGRAKLAVLVAPFRALCHEIGTSLRNAFKNEDVKINELSDVMQLDFIEQIADLFGSETPSEKYILVVTPEKLLYVLRQEPTLVDDIGIVVYDEGHQFDSGSRGITYELLLTQIKALLAASAQTILVSAVIQNAQAIGDWLIGDGVKVVNGSGLLPTARSVAFASWIERIGQIMFFESNEYDQPDFFVPRIIEQQTLTKRAKERKDRVFPEGDSSNDVALYLGFRLVPQGAVAIFCGRKDTSFNMASRAVEVYSRGFSVAPPAASANSDELQRMKNLIDAHFGEQSVLSQSAMLGVFVHHGTTPQGLRLSIEYAMQKGLINFVACTSTLAQGVNLPIRYLLVSGIHQGAERIKVRDFQNLIGRAGRSGMHTEGLVIFSDPAVYDKRLDNAESWRFDSSIELLSPDRAESTTSSLLDILGPFESNDRKAVLNLTGDDLCLLLLNDEASWQEWATEVVAVNPQFKFDAKTIVGELRLRRRFVSAIESYLMANRGTSTFEEFESGAVQLAESTLAYHLASDEVKPAVRLLFTSIAKYLQQQAPEPAKQAVYAKTLLGVKSAKAIEQWVTANRDALLVLDSNNDWLVAIWELFSEQSDDKFFHSVEPESLPIQLANLWLQGSSYRELFSLASDEGGSKPWGNKRRRLTDDDVVSFFEHTLGFECALVVAAVIQFLFGEELKGDESSAALSLFQKALKYGLPDLATISCFEFGFSDRVIAQCLCDACRSEGFTGDAFAPAFASHREAIEIVLKDFPRYFESVFASRT